MPDSNPSTSSSQVGISFADLLAYHRDEARCWREWLRRQKEDVLDISLGDNSQQVSTVRQMLLHIFLVEWIYTDILSGKPIESPAGFSNRISLDDLFAMADRADAGFGAFLANASPASMDEVVTMPRTGRTGTRRKFMMHVLLHSARHWAQLAMVLRQHGHSTDWGHDLLMSSAVL